MIAILDCGTTNTKCYIVDENKCLLGEGYSAFGCKDNALKADREDYKRSLCQLVHQTCEKVGKNGDVLTKVIAFGMISADVGLLVVPHLVAPAGMEEFHASMYRVEEKIFGPDVEFLLIRGIKNPLEDEHSISNLETCDFMRGEETQIMGVLETYKPKGRCNVIVFGSHFKIIHVSEEGKIVSSMTTISGQIFDCLCKHTLIASSLTLHDPEEKASVPMDEILDISESVMEERGLMRALMLPRFMESFTDMNAADRLLYLDAVLALEDLKSIPEYTGDGCFGSEEFFFIGQRVRCEVFAEVLRRKQPNVKITILGSKEENRDISIAGALAVAGA